MKYHIQLLRDALGGQYPEPRLWEGVYREKGSIIIRPVAFRSRRAADHAANRINRSRGDGAAVVVEAQ